MATIQTEADRKIQSAKGGRLNADQKLVNVKGGRATTNNQPTQDLMQMSKAEAEKALRAGFADRGIAVDSLARPADTRVDREVEVINEAQNRQPSTALTGDIRNAVATTTPEPIEAERLSTADQLAQEIAGTTQEGFAQDIQTKNEELRIQEKEERARTLSNQLVGREREIQKQRERLEKNLRADSRGGLESKLAKFNRESARELADLSFSYQVALGDYNAAEKIASDYADDLQQDLVNKQNTWQMLFTMEQNDMTESEKMQAQQAFQEKQMQDQFEMDKKLASFKQELSSAGADGLGFMGAGMFTTEPTLSLEEFIAQKEEQAGQTFTPETRRLLEQEYNALYRTPQQVTFDSLSSQQFQQLSGATRSIVKNPQGFDKLTPTMQGEVLEELGNYGIDAAPLFPDQSSANAARAAFTVVRDGQTALDKMSASRLFFQNGQSVQNPLAASQRAVAASIPGTDTYEIAKSIQSVKDNIGIDALLNIKREGSGLGQVPQKQLESLQGLLGRLDITREPSLLKRDIEDALRMYQDILDKSGSEIMDVMSNPVTRLDRDTSLETPNSYFDRQSSTDIFQSGDSYQLGGEIFEQGADGLYYSIN